MATIGEAKGPDRTAWADVFDTPPVNTQESYQNSGSQDSQMANIMAAASVEADAGENTTSAAATAASPPATACPLSQRLSSYRPQGNGLIIAGSGLAGETERRRGPSHRATTQSVAAEGAPARFAAGGGTSAAGGGTSAAATGASTRRRSIQSQARQPNVGQTPGTRNVRQRTTTPVDNAAQGRDQRVGADQSIATVLVEEEDRQRRMRKRMDTLSKFKNSLEYRRVCELRARNAGDELPSTPDPHDETISKRSWETAVQQWRNKVKRFLEPGVVVLDLTDE